MGGIFTRSGDADRPLPPTPAEIEAYFCRDHIRLGKLLTILEHKTHFQSIVRAVFDGAVDDLSTERLTMLKNRWPELIEDTQWSILIRKAIDGGYIDIFDLAIQPDTNMKQILQLICLKNKFDLLRHVLEQYPRDINDIEPMVVADNVVLENLLETCVAADAVECFDQLIISGLNYHTNDKIFTRAVNFGSRRMAIRLFDLGLASDDEIRRLVSFKIGRECDHVILIGRGERPRRCRQCSPLVELRRVAALDITEDHRIFKRVLKISPFLQRIVKKYYPYVLN